MPLSLRLPNVPYCRWLETCLRNGVTLARWQRSDLFPCLSKRWGVALQVLGSGVFEFENLKDQTTDSDD